MNIAIETMHKSTYSKKECRREGERERWKLQQPHKVALRWEKDKHMLYSSGHKPIQGLPKSLKGSIHHQQRGGVWKAQNRRKERERDGHLCRGKEISPRTPIIKFAWESSIWCKFPLIPFILITSYSLRLSYPNIYPDDPHMSCTWNILRVF